MPRIPKAMFFADGENLVFRFQEMWTAGRQPLSDVIHIRDEFVWAPKITTGPCFDIIRTTFYTSACGDEAKINSLRKRISSVEYSFSYTPDNEIPAATAGLVPCVFKKERQSKKSRSVDVQMTIDLLRHAMRHDCDQFVILTGDGDFIPIIRESMALGIEVRVMGFSSGLNPELAISADSFELLDDHFFQIGSTLLS